MLRLVRQQVRGFIGREAKRAHISLNVALKVHNQESTTEEYAREYAHGRPVDALSRIQATAQFAKVTSNRTIYHPAAGFRQHLL